MASYGAAGVRPDAYQNYAVYNDFDTQLHAMIHGHLTAKPAKRIVPDLQADDSDYNV